MLQQAHAPIGGLRQLAGRGVTVIGTSRRRPWLTRALLALALLAAILALGLALGLQAIGLAVALLTAVLSLALLFLLRARPRSR